MIIKFHKVNLKKKHPLRISRGLHDKTQNLFIQLTEDGITSWGESAPGKFRRQALVLLPKGSGLDRRDQKILRSAVQ